MHRRIGPTASTQTKNNPNDGEEVNVVPPPAKIAKVIPDYTTIKLPWHEYRTSKLSATRSQDVWPLRLNSIVDPGVNFTNHRPMGYTHWSTLYKYYRVLEAQVNVTFRYNYGFFENVEVATANEPYTMSVAVGYEPTDDTNDVYPNFQSMVEGKHSKVEWLHPKDIEVLSTGETNAEKVLCSMRS